MAVRRKDDSLWKSVLEDVFDDFLRFFFPDADKLFDMPKGFTFLDKELLELYPEPGEKSDTRVVPRGRLTEEEIMEQEVITG